MNRLIENRKFFKSVIYCSVIILICLVSIGSSFAAQKVIGVVMTGKIPYYDDIHNAFIDEMNRSGIISKKNIQIIVQKPAPEAMAWTNAVRKLVAFDVDIIVTYGAPVTQTALRATSKIPVVFAGVYNPEAVNVLTKNATGISSGIPTATVLKNLKSISQYSRLGIVYNDVEQDTVAQAEEVKKLEGKFGFTSTMFNIKRKGEEARIKDVDALYMTTSCAAMYCAHNIIGRARDLKIPTASTIGGGEDAGVLLTIAADPSEQGTRAAQIVAKVLKGAKPDSLPVEKPKKVYMVVNLREAQSLGMNVPFNVLTSATKVIK